MPSGGLIEEGIAPFQFGTLLQPQPRSRHQTASVCTPLARMLPRVIGAGSYGILISACVSCFIQDQTTFGLS